MRQIEKLESWRIDLAIAETFEEVRLHESAASAAAEFARREKMSIDKQNEIGRFRIEIEAKKGGWLKEHFPHGGDRKSDKIKLTNGQVDLMPATYKESSRSRTIHESMQTEPDLVYSIMDDIENEGDVITPGKVQTHLKRAHVSNNSGNNEWYTPPEYIESAQRVMGWINLDPASSEIANRVVEADKFYDVDDNGLLQNWHGNIWMNPPYSQPLISHFIEKLGDKTYAQAIVLVNNATETKWGQKLLSLASAVCFPSGRIRFYNKDGERGDAPLQGQMIAYVGENYSSFAEEFHKYGICLLRGE